MKIAVMGSAGSSVGRAPFKDANYDKWVQGRVNSIQVAHDHVPGDWDIWGCSPGCWAVIPRATRWFEVHRWEVGVAWFTPQYVQFLRDFKGPVYTGGSVPEITNHVVYPLDRMEEKFSSYNMTSSLALMLALAIDTIEQIRAARKAYKGDLPAGTEGFGTNGLPAHVSTAELYKTDDDDVIGLWGVDMAAADEYAYQRPGCQNFVLEAMRRGIGMYLPPESDLMRPMPVYGISEWDHNYIKLTSRARELSAVLGETQGRLQADTQKAAALQGESHALQAFVSTWTSPYGMLPGMVIRQQPGTGMGSGITHFDGRPVTRMVMEPKNPEQAAVVQAMAAPDPVEQELKSIVAQYSRETGATVSEPASAALQRAIEEARIGRDLAGALQQFVQTGESSMDVLRRIIEKPKGKTKR